MCSINSYAATSSAGILNFGPLPIPFALPRSTRNGPLSREAGEHGTQFTAGRLE